MEQINSSNEEYVSDSDDEKLFKHTIKKIEKRLITKTTKEDMIKLYEKRLKSYNNDIRSDLLQKNIELCAKILTYLYNNK